MRNFLLVCDNGSGEKITIGYRWPLWLDGVDGLTSSDFDVDTEKGNDQDGEHYKSSTAAKRNIVIYCWVKDNIQAMREKLYSYFPRGETGTLYVTDEGITRKIDYKPEFVHVDPTGQQREVTISLVCPDPKFKAVTDDRVEMAVRDGMIEFPDDVLELPTEAFEMTTKRANLAVAVENASNVARGLTVQFIATGTVTNPSLFEVRSQKGFKIRCQMHAGDVLTVTTGFKNKRIMLKSDGVEKGANNMWVFGSTWLQVEPGSNVFRYDAESGVDNLDVVMSSTPVFWGV